MVHSTEDESNNQVELQQVEAKYTAIETSLNHVCDQMDVVLQNINEIQTGIQRDNQSEFSLAETEYHLADLKMTYNACYQYAARKSQELRDVHFLREIVRSHTHRQLTQAPSTA
jgi:hypothetical protein